MSIVFNIGLAVSRPTNVLGNVAGDIVPFTEVLRALPTWHIVDLRLINSPTERTLIVELDSSHEWVLDLANRLAIQFDQDCVAVYNRSTGEGLLIGPHADKWAPFNPACFFLCDGESLATHYLKEGYGAHKLSGSIN